MYGMIDILKDMKEKNLKQKDNGGIMGLFDLFLGSEKEDEEDKLKKEFIKKCEQEEYNFEEEDLEEDDYYYEDDKD